MELTIKIKPDEVRLLVVAYLETLGIKVDPAKLGVRYSGGYDDQEFDGYECIVDVDGLKGLIVP